MNRDKETQEMNQTLDKVVQARCIDCSRTTRHKVVASLDTAGPAGVDLSTNPFYWSDNYQVIQCQGCLAVSFRHLSFFSEEQYHHSDDDYCDGTSESLYPRRSEHLRATLDFFSTPPVLRRIYRETLMAYNSESATLCAAGLRALVEGICAEEGVKEGTAEWEDPIQGPMTRKESSLRGKIFGLAEKGVLTKPNSSALHSLRFLGNEAVHELSSPPSEELFLAIDIVEHMLESLYEIPEKSSELRGKKNIREAKKVFGTQTPPPSTQD